MQILIYLASFLWHSSVVERDEIVADIQEALDDYAALPNI